MNTNAIAPINIESSKYPVCGNISSLGCFGVSVATYSVPVGDGVTVMVGVSDGRAVPVGVIVISVGVIVAVCVRVDVTVLVAVIVAV
jgi:hypothetical protein